MTYVSTYDQTLLPYNHHQNTDFSSPILMRINNNKKVDKEITIKYVSKTVKWEGGLNIKFYYNKYDQTEKVHYN